MKAQDIVDFVEAGQKLGLSAEDLLKDIINEMGALVVLDALREPKTLNPPQPQRQKIFAIKEFQSFMKQNSQNCYWGLLECKQAVESTRTFGLVDWQAKELNNLLKPFGYTVKLLVFGGGYIIVPL